MNKFGFAAFCVALFAVTAGGFGYTFDDVVVEVEVGAGTKQAMLVIDFGGDNSYAWSYKWDGAATGEDMLLAMNAGTELEVDYHIDPTWGFGLDALRYGGYEVISDGWFTTFPGYWWAGHDEYLDFVGDTVPAWDNNGQDDWLVAQVGAGTRQLADGYWDGWSQEYMANGFDPVHTPQTPVPEPATLCLLAAGGLALLRRRRK